MPEPIKASIPPSVTPNGLPSYFSGNGYSPSTDLDMPGSTSANSASLGKPYAKVPVTIPKTFMSPETTIQEEDTSRVAATFDPTKAQPVKPEMLQNGRMPTSVSDMLRKEFGASSFQELDHIMPLELGGSNNALTNLRKENGEDTSQPYAPSKNPTPTDPLENQLAAQVHSGKISLLDAWRQMAKAKGITLKEDSAKNNPIQDWLLNSPNVLLPLAAVQGAMEKVPEFIKNVTGTSVDAISSLYVKSGPVQFASDAEVHGFAQAVSNMFSPTSPTNIWDTRSRLTSNDIDQIVQKRDSYIAAGMDTKQATISAAAAVKAKKNQEAMANLAMGSLGGPGEVKPNLIKDISEKLGLPDLWDGFTHDVKTVAQDPRFNDVNKASMPFIVGSFMANSPEGEMFKAAQEGLNGLKLTPELLEEGRGVIKSVSNMIGEDGKLAVGETIKGTTPTPEQKFMANAFEETRKTGAVHFNVDEETKITGFSDTVSRDTGKSGGVKGFATNLKNAWEDWVNGRAAARTRAMFTRGDYESLDSEGMDGIFKFQAGEGTGKYGALRQFFDERYAQLQSAGVDVDYKANYAPQLWANTPQEVQSALGDRRLGLHPSFTMESIFKDYQEGIQAGLTPKYTKISDLAAWYEQRSSKLLADQKFFTESGKNGWILPTTQAPHLGWRIIDPNVFPLTKATFGDMQYVGTFSAPEPLANAIENYLQKDDGGFEAVAKFNTLTKNIILTTGVPNTALNFHGYTETARSVLAAENPAKAFAKTVYWLLKPSAAQDFISQNSAMATFFTEHGLTFSSEDHALKDMMEPSVNGALTKERDTLAKFFSDPLFNKVIPALKLDKAKEIMSYLVDHGYDQKGAAKIASKQANDFFGGLNLDQIGRSKQTQNLFRSLAFAPDFMETSFNIGKGIASSLRNFSNAEGHAYRVFARNLLMTYIGMNVVNKLTTGKFMYQNDVGHEFDIGIGKDAAGKTRYLRPLGTAVDFVRVPVEIATDIAHGNIQEVSQFIRNRVSVPLGTIETISTGQDAYGNPIYDPNATAVQNGISALRQGIGIVAPQAVQAGVDWLRGKIDSEQAISQTLGLPVRYQANSQTTDTIATMIYTNRPKLEARIKQDYANGKTDDATSVMASFNKQLITATIQDYKDHSYKIANPTAFYNWLVATNSTGGGLKDFLLKPPTDKSLSAYQSKQGKSLFQKMFNLP